MISPGSVSHQSPPKRRGGGTVSCQKGPGLLETQSGLSEETDQHTEAIERQAAAHLPTCAAAMLADTLVAGEPKMCSTGAQTKYNLTAPGIEIGRYGFGLQ